MQPSSHRASYTPALAPTVLTFFGHVPLGSLPIGPRSRCVVTPAFAVLPRCRLHPPYTPQPIHIHATRTHTHTHTYTSLYLPPSPPLFPHALTALSSSPLSSKARVLVLSNSFVSAQLDVTSGRIIALTGDFNGTRTFPATNNALASPWHLETEDTSGVVSSSSAAPTLTILSNTSTLVSVKLEGVTDSAGDGSGDGVSAAVATEDWTVTLRSNERGVELNTTGTATVTAASKTRCVLLWRDRLGGVEGWV